MIRPRSPHFGPTANLGLLLLLLVACQPATRPSSEISVNQRGLGARLTKAAETKTGASREPDAQCEEGSSYADGEPHGGGEKCGGGEPHQGDEKYEDDEPSEGPASGAGGAGGATAIR